MRFLRILGFVAVGIWLIRHVFMAVFLPDRCPDGDDRFLPHIDAVGSHIGDQANRLAAKRDAFIQLLRGPHGAGSAESELAGRFLLHRRRGERRRGAAVYGFPLNRFDRVVV